MSYVETIVRPGETVLAVGRLHWIAYAKAVLLFLAGSAAVIVEYVLGADQALIIGSAVLLYGSALIAFIHAWFVCWITEFAVTDRRVIYKTGFINRRTAEMNMDAVESVEVYQSVLGRLLDYGTVHVLGRGRGIEHLHRIRAPIALRNAITAK